MLATKRGPDHATVFNLKSINNDKIMFSTETQKTKRWPNHCFFFKVYINFQKRYEGNKNEKIAKPLLL